jgi:hypothetical protein
MATEIVSQKNNAPTDKHDSHHVYYFGIDDLNIEKPFILGESIGGGFGERGGQSNFDFEGLFKWQAGWQEHIEKSGCAWVIEIILAAYKENDPKLAIVKILNAGGGWK